MSDDGILLKSEEAELISSTPHVGHITDLHVSFFFESRKAYLTFTSLGELRNCVRTGLSFL